MDPPKTLVPLHCATLWSKYYYPLFYGETSDLREIKYVSNSFLYNKEQWNGLNPGLLNFKHMQSIFLFNREQIHEEGERILHKLSLILAKSHCSWTNSKRAMADFRYIL